MITAIATGDDGKRVMLLGVTRENVTRLMKDQPIRVSAETHPGFPTDTTIVIVFGETEGAITERIKSLISDDTKVIAVPRNHPGIS
jgi:hypothetical protein